jgi:hypothetical protein
MIQAIWFQQTVFRTNINWTNMIRAIWLKQTSIEQIWFEQFDLNKCRSFWSHDESEKKMQRRCRYCERRIKHKEGVAVRRIEPDFEECEWVFESFFLFLLDARYFYTSITQFTIFFNQKYESRFSRCSNKLVWSSWWWWWRHRTMKLRSFHLRRSLDN